MNSYIHIITRPSHVDSAFCVQLEIAAFKEHRNWAVTLKDTAAPKKAATKEKMKQAEEKKPAETKAKELKTNDRPATK